MKRVIVFILNMIMLLALASCSSSGVLKSPVGSYAFGSTSFTFEKKGAFSIEHEASAEDKNNYVITGTYTYTLDQTDLENEISYGKIDISITGITLEGPSVQKLEVTTNHTGTDLSSGDELLGWWKYTNLITYPGKMRVGFNLASTGYRPETVDTGRDWLIIGDPK